jgi:hypothetical protein
MSKELLHGISTTDELRQAIEKNPEKGNELKALYIERRKALEKFESSLTGEDLKRYQKALWPQKIKMYREKSEQKDERQGQTLNAPPQVLVQTEGALSI